MIDDVMCVSSAPHAAADTISVFIVPRRVDVVVGDGQDGVNDWYYNAQYYSYRRIIIIICVCTHRYHYYITTMSGTNILKIFFFIEKKLSRILIAYYANRYNIVFKVFDIHYNNIMFIYFHLSSLLFRK